VEFLLIRPDCPRSVCFCLESAARALEAIEGPEAGRELSKADRLLGLMLADLRYRRLDSILQGDLHDFLAGLQERCAQVGRAVQERYSLR
jgi:uncharacterized alpha-E superfamily protein